MKIIDYIFRIMKFFILILFLLYPIYSLILIPFIIINFFIKINKPLRYIFVFASFFLVVLFNYLYYNIFIERGKYLFYILLDYKKIDFIMEIKKWLFYVDRLYIPFFLFVLSFSIFVLNFKTKKDILTDEEKRNEVYRRTLSDNIMYFINKYIIKTKGKHTKEFACFGFNYKDNKPLSISVDDGHILSVGTTGSGKTATLTNLIEQAIEYNHFTIIVDGKGDKSKYSLYDSTKKLAKKYNKNIYIVSQGDEETDFINPFKNCDSTQIKDMLISLSDWSEEHYKSNASRFWQALAELMILNKKNISINTIINQSDKKSYISLVNNLANQGLITKMDSKRYLKIYELSSEIALASISRFATLVEGSGGNLFKDDGIDITDIYNENAIVVFLIDKFKFPEFAKNLGEIILLDIKKLISTLMKNKNGRKVDKFLLVLDEVGVYASEKILDILNKARVTNNQTIISTQSLSDLDDVTPNFRSQVIDNCNSYLIMRNNDPDNAELLSGIIGTKKKNFTTYQTDTELTYSTGVGTFKVVDEYIINPDKIKKFKKLTGIFYSKTKEEFKVFKSRLVDLKDFDEIS